MNYNFELHNAFKAKCEIIDLPLCKILMESSEIPWILLIPRVADVRQINHLKERDRARLMEEIALASDIMEKLFPTDMLNIAAIGNKTPQLHIHVISRNKSDSLWPETVWGRETKKLSPEEIMKRSETIRSCFVAQT
jgi:diadenosine tetraphosphate (Ap4A) HIT family hydrolase